MKNHQYTAGIISCLVLIIAILIGTLFYIPHMNLPEKKTLNPQTDSAILETDIKVGGSVHSGNLWNYYYGKTKEEVESIAPMFLPMENDIYRLDRGFLNEEMKEAVTDVMCMFDNNTLQVLTLSMQTGKEICGFDGKYTYNENDFTLVFEAALASMVLMGLDSELDEDNLENQIFPNDDKTVYFITTNNDVTCYFETCPGSLYTFSCLKDPYVLQRIIDK